MKIRFRIPTAVVLASAVLVSVLWPAQSLDENVHAVRRARLRSTIHGQAILHSGSGEPAGLDKNFYYLSGLALPDVFLLLNSATGMDMLFIDPAKIPMPVAEIIRTSGIAAIFLRDQAGMFLADHLASDPDVYFPFAYSPSDPAYIYPDCLVIEQLVNGLPYCHKLNLGEFLYPMRMVKDRGEIALMEQAVDITRRGALAGIAALRPGLYEYEVQRVVEDTFRALGAPRTSFASIIGSGPNSLILHYFENSRRMEAGDVVVMDVGAEYGRYAGDITRTAPVSGKFTPRQREVYEIVLEMQSRVFAACRPGVTLADLNNVARAYATEKGYGDYFNFSGWHHGTSHSLGLDTHDPFISGRPLAAGMVITVEPGIYLPAENLGMRLEDDVLITETVGVVLTADVPREAADIEAVMAGRFQPGPRGDRGRETIPAPGRREGKN
jgi:Xaa-Pro aminopeptidase